jgi:error-prone DNA polymerase
MVSDFGRSNVFVELWDHGLPMDSVRNDAMAELAAQVGVDIIATGNVHHHSVARKRLASAMAAVRARRSLDEIDGWLPPAGMHLRSGEEQAFRFRRYPGVVQRAYELGMDCAFDLSLVAPNLPPYPCPDGLDEMGYLRRLVEEGGTRRYGPRSAERVEGAWAQLDRELDLIDELGFPGYFLVVWDIVDFCRRADILCQGRGSAANSAVCFALGITNADAVSLGLLFERFLSPERDGPPDIDIDIESDRREEVIQYVYDRHGRHHTAQVANVITYRSKSAIRDMAKALGYAQGQQDAFSTQVDRWRDVLSGAIEDDTTIPLPVVELAAEIEHFPRHLGIHSGGMVMCDRPVIEVCPVEWGRMEDRSVLQWDKDDCAAAGLVKFDLLGLGMLSVLHYATDLIAEHHGVEVDLATLPQESCVYDMLQKADSIGVFQIESRAQMATLPRLKPRTFYDLVVEVALIGRARSRAAQCIPTSAVETVSNPSPTSIRCSRTRWPRPSACRSSGAVDADRNRRRELHPGRRRHAASGNGFQAQPRAHGRSQGPVLRRDADQRHHRRHRRADLAETRRLLQLRLPREPLGVVLLSRLCVVVDQVPLSGGVLCCAFEGPADGVLVAAHAGRRCPSPRGGSAHPRPQPVGCHGHVGAV